MQIYRISYSTPQVHRICKAVPAHTTTRNMAFFPRFVAHDFAPMFSRQESNLFRLLDDYAGIVANRGGSYGPSFTQSMRTFQPRFDMKESKDSYELHGELPGIAQKDINIEFTDANTLSIRGRTETVREEGRNPNAAIEAQPEQQKLTDAAADAAETESVGSSTNYHKASVEDEATASATESKATPVETPAASEAPNAQEVATQSQQAEGPNYWFSERSVGSFARSFSFPQRVDQEAVKASLKDGILSIVVPKAPAPENRRIEIQ